MSRIKNRAFFMNTILECLLTRAFIPDPPYEIEMTDLSRESATNILAYQGMLDYTPVYHKFTRVATRFTKDGRCKVKISETDMSGYVVVTITNVTDAKNFYRYLNKLRDGMRTHTDEAMFGFAETFNNGTL